MAILIGIDTGTNTGLAVWDSRRRGFLEVKTYKIHQAMQRVMDFSLIAEKEETTLKVYFEDARLRKWYTGGAEKKQGAGSIKRDAVIWQDFLTDLGIEFSSVAPHKGMTKLKPEYFERLTGWKGRTSHHARDAAMLVFGR